MDEIVLVDEAAHPDSKINIEDKDTITAFLRDKVEELIAAAERKWHEQDREEDEVMQLPLIRLKVSQLKLHSLQVETTGVKEMTNPIRFGQDYSGRVANPRDILQYHRKKQASERSKLSHLS